MSNQNQALSESIAALSSEVDLSPSNPQIDQAEVDNIMSTAEPTPAEIETRAKAHRHELINVLIESLLEPLKKEQEDKVKYRQNILKRFAQFFVCITLATFLVLFLFMTDGYTTDETEVVKVLITGVFVNLIALAIIIFKYLFDDKNSLFKDIIQLVGKTLGKSSDDEEH